MASENTRKKILLYTRPIAPPWDEASKNLAWELAKNCQGDFEFHVLATKNSSLEIQGGKINLEPIFSSASFGFWAKIKLFGRLFRWNLDADIVHFLFIPRPLTSFFIKLRLFFSKAKTIQTIATIRDGFYRNPKKLKSFLFGNKIIAQSQFTLSRLKSVGIENATLIYPAIDLEKFHPTKKDPGLMDKLKIDPSDIVILFAAEYTKIGGIDDVIKAFEILHYNVETRQWRVSTKGNYKLIIACRIKNQADREKKRQIQKQISGKPFEKNIIFMESVMDMAKVYNLSDINLFTVTEMTGKFDIPFVMIEAMACAKPIIISDIPVLREFVKEDYNGLVAKGNEPENIAGCIEKLAQSSQLRTELGQNALQYAQENFDIKKTAKKYEEIYKNL